jgi:hypothetical protein
MTFVVTHVRQALQQTVAIGACSPYLAAARPMRPEAISFMPTWYAGRPAFVPALQENVCRSWRSWILPKRNTTTLLSVISNPYVPAIPPFASLL